MAIGLAALCCTASGRRVHCRWRMFSKVVTPPAEIAEQVAVLARRVAEDVVAEGRPAARVAVKVRFAPFFTHTRSMTLPAPTSEAADIEAAALEGLSRFADDRPIRLLGVRAEFASS